MGKNKSAAQAAAENQQAPKTNEKKGVEVIQAGDLLNAAKTGGQSVGLSPDATVMALNGLKTMVHDNPKAAEYYNLGEEGVKKINHFTLAGFATVLAIECMNRKSEFAIKMLEKQPEAINAIAEFTGVTIDTKLLPAPNDKGEVEVPSTAVKISKEAEKGLKEEIKIANEETITDPTKIENEEQLKKSLLKILVKGNGNDNFYQKVVTAINFYESFLSIKASKSENKEEELAAIKAKSRADLLSEIAKLLGKCTFTIGGMAKFMFENTKRTKNPVSAFCTLRNASLNETTGMPQVEDSLIADIVKVLIRWYADSEIEEANVRLSNSKKDLEVLKKDEKKNKKAIESGNNVIANIANYIAEIEDVVTYVNVPDRSIVDNFIADYTNDKSEGYKFARMMGSKIVDTYYGGTKAKDYEQDPLIHNLQQYVGIIFNLFLPSTEMLIEYSEANITELTPKKTEEKND